MTPINWFVVYPEVLLLVMACIVALVDVWSSDPRRRLTFWLTQATFAAVAVLHFRLFDVGDTLYGMQGMVVADPMGHLLAAFSALAMLVTVAYSQAYIASREMLKGEFFTLAMFALLGISVMVSANNFLVMYVGLELMSLSLYALVALRRDHPVATEAAMKYFVLGALASGFLLYGLSMMYGATGSLDLPEVFKAIQTGRINADVLTLGIVFVVAGLSFKLGVAPFHMWVPDVYHGAPTAVTLMIASAPKLGAFAMTMRLLVEAFTGLAGDWQQMLIVASVASMLVGNVAAIAQTNLKRMLAYSAIAQMGFMLLGLTPTVISANTISAANGYSSAMFYIVTYLITTLGTFGLIMLLARQGFECDEITDLSGLAQRSPWLAGVMAAFMFSLAGIPPLVGFYAKFAVLQSIVSTNVPGYIWLAVIAVLLSLVGAFYYLRVVKVMYFDAPLQQPSQPQALVVGVGGGAAALMAINGLATLVLGVLPDGLMGMCRDAIIRALAT
jgi:NADH-quinone oxidoreductase subunit N